MIHPFNVINWSCRSNINCSSAIHIPQQARSGPLIHKQWVIMAGHLYNRVMYQLRPRTVGIWDKKEQNRAAYYLTSEVSTHTEECTSHSIFRVQKTVKFIFFMSRYSIRFFPPHALFSQRSEIQTAPAYKMGFT